MRSSKGAAGVLLALAVALAVGNLYETLRRSSIPLAFDGTVTAAEVRHEKHPGVDDVHLVEVGDRTFHLDAAVAERLDRGESISKAAWSRSVSVDGRRLDLDVSRDGRGMVVVMPLVLTVILWLLSAGRNDRARRSEGF